MSESWGKVEAADMPTKKRWQHKRPCNSKRLTLSFVLALPRPDILALLGACHQPSSVSLEGGSIKGRSLAA